MPLQNNINLFCFLLSFSGSNFVCLSIVVILPGS
jgi:hypothetical protein